MDCSTPGFPVLHHLPELTQTHVHRVSDAIQPSHPLSSPFSSCLQSLPASGSFLMSHLFASGGWSIGASASATVLPVSIHEEFMIWSTVSSQSCFYWLYRASLSLAAKNIISLILVLTIWWCPGVELSLVLLEEGICYDQCVLLAKLYLPLPCFILSSKTKLPCYTRYFLTSYFCITVPDNERTSILGVSSRRSCRSS